MEEITKELGHRPSVSMPSLDATDDFSSESVSTENTNTVFTTTDSTFVSTASTETVGVLSEGSDALSSNTMSFTSTDSALQENVDASCVEEASEATLIEHVASEPLIQQETDVLQAEGLDDSQGDEDPSAAIDQFIKKIADEQLSSKRIEERKEEDAIEQKQQIDSHDLSLDTKNTTDSVVAVTDSPILLEENIPHDVEANGDTQLIENTEGPLVENVQPQPIEVDGDEKAQVSSENNVLDVAANEQHMQAESIEEIQKEIDKIPSKKPIEEGQKVPAKQDENGDHGTESIEDILEDKIDKKITQGEILKSALEKQNKGSTEDSLEVAKDPILIEKAQEEVKKLDVLVCGGCHNTFHFVQDFSDHKKGKCAQNSNITVETDNDSKPQVWGFILWKLKQTKDMEENKSSTSAWSIYQRWCKLPQADKIAWISAGQSIQFASKIGSAKLTEVKPGTKAKTPVQRVTYEATSEFVDSNKENSSRMQEEIRKGISKPVKLNNDVTILPSTKAKDEFVVEKIMAKRFNPRKKTWEYNIKWENFGHDSNTWEPIGNLSHCKKMLDQFEEQLKRMKEEKAKQAQSPKGRGRPSNARSVKINTSPYIPIAPKQDGSLKISNVVGGVSDDYGGSSSGNRPQRSSKQKALSQVKQWCGNISDEDAVPTGFKRKHSDSDSDEDYDDKKIKMEEDSDDSEKAVKSKGIFKKLSTSTLEKQSPIRNGAQQILPSNILIPDANGVVRINQKQLPSLSSGVYIMSKTAGIIKLDSTTSKVATSGGQTIVKVAPKIGQTQIKIVKKDGTTTKQVIQVSPKVPVTSTPVKVTPVKSSTLPKSVSSTPKLRPQVKKSPLVLETVTPKLFTKKPEPVSTPKPEPAKEEESDDGLEPLPFPDVNDPIPEVEEPQDESFELDPFTGKLAGVEYVDKPVVIKEEPQPLPPTTNELENIVKIAAAEITKDELVLPSQDEEDPLFTAPKKVKRPVNQTPVKTESGQLMRKVVKYTVKDGVGTETTVLMDKSTAAAQPRAIISPVRSAVPQRPRPTQQKVINQMVSRPMTSMGTTKTVVRHVIGPQKPGGNLNVVRKTITQQTMSPRSRFNLTPQKPLPSPLQPNRTYSSQAGVRPQGPASKVQVYSKPTPMGRPAGQPNPNRNTMIRSSSSAQIQTTQRTQSGQLTSTPKPVTRIVQRVVTSPKKPDNQTALNRSLSQKARPVINMPSLTDEDLPLSPRKAAKAPLVSHAQKSVVMADKKEMTVTKTAESAVEKMDTSVAEEASAEQGTDWSSFTMADTENPIYITGDDGTIYQVAGQNEQGQTILITQGPDGQQQCLLVTNEIGELAGEEQPSTSTATTAGEAAPTATEANTAVVQESDAVLSTVATSVSESLQTPLQIKTDTEMEAMDDDVQDQVVAQVVRAEPPSPGGTHKVVVMLPDGNLMVTQVSPEEYASLELE